MPEVPQDEPHQSPQEPVPLYDSLKQVVDQGGFGDPAEHEQRTQEARIRDLENEIRELTEQHAELVHRKEAGEKGLDELIDKTQHSLLSARADLVGIRPPHQL